MLFTDLLKDDLVKAVRFYKVDVDVNANKQAIADALLDAGITPEQWDRESYEHDFGAKPEENGGAIITESFRESEEEEALADPVAVDEDTDVDEDVEESEEEPLVLVRFVGKNRSYRTGKHVFSANRPFALMAREEYDRLDTKKFREATRSEALEYYN